MRESIRITESELGRIVLEEVMHALREGRRERDENIFGEHGMFVIDMLDEPFTPSFTDTTRHWDERKARLERMGRNAGDVLYSFVLDRGHGWGMEIHSITEKACIIISNYETEKPVTVLLARPSQILRYWRNLEIPVPHDSDFDMVMRYARNNSGRGVTG